MKMSFSISCFFFIIIFNTGIKFAVTKGHEYHEFYTASILWVRQDSNKKISLYRDINHCNPFGLPVFLLRTSAFPGEACWSWGWHGVYVGWIGWSLQRSRRFEFDVCVDAGCMIVEGRIVENSNWNECNDLRQFNTLHNLGFRLIIHD